MAESRRVAVHLLPSLAPAGALAGGTAVVIDVLRASTTIVHALAAGCLCVRPVAEVEEARRLADGMPAGKVVLGGERGGKPLPGFDRGNSPTEYTPAACKGTTVVLTTSNGTRALLRAAEADRVLVAAFVNFSAVCEALKANAGPVHVLCSGSEGEPSFEDTVLAGALVDFLTDQSRVELNDSARLAWDAFENNRPLLRAALETGRGGETLVTLGYDEDLDAAARVDQFAFVPELRRDPLRVEIGPVGVTRKWWPE